MPENNHLDKFYWIFRGNTDFFVKHQAPFKKHEGKLKAAWTGMAVYNKHDLPPDGKELGDFIPVTKESYREHLNGGDGLAVAPITNTDAARNVCFYAAIDIDVYETNFTQLVNRLYTAGFKFAAFLSKSGGLHIYFFFADPEPADKAISALKKIVETFGLKKLYKNKVEIFPKQAAFVPGDTNASCLFLPFYNAANKSSQNMLTTEGKLLGLAKALPVIESMFTSVKEVNAITDALPYNDAPYCVQMLLLNGALAEGGRRNVFLFAVSLYMKAAHKEGFEDKLLAANNCLQAPLDETEIRTIYTSAMSKDWPFTGWCKEEPMCSYCDRKLCKERKFGVGRERNSYVSNIEHGQIIRMCSAVPYYLWELKPAGAENFTQVRFDSEEDLLNQKVVQRACIRYLNTMPLTMKQAVWEEKIGGCLSTIEECEVPKEMDTSEIGVLHDLFIRFLTHKQVKNGQPYMVRFGQVYHANGAYYFTTKGLIDFLRSEQFSLRGINLEAKLKDYGCAQGELKYAVTGGKEKMIKCLVKQDSEELSEMETFYEDVYSGHTGMLQKSSLENDSEEESNADIKF